MRFCVLDGIFLEAWVIVVNFTDGVVMVDMMPFLVDKGVFVILVFWREKVGSKLRNGVSLVFKNS